MLIAALLAATFASTPAAAALDWQGRHASMQAAANGSYVLHDATGERRIPAPRYATDTASPLFNGLYAMAQDDLAQDSVSAIRDGAYDRGQPIACNCFATGAKWPYVWTRDLSYAIDLGLARFDPARARTSLAFKLSYSRVAGTPRGPFVMQDTGSGGSWPISTDRVVWFLAARHLLDDTTFANTTWAALTATLAQDRAYVFDAATGLYRGETSFLDWREQSYPAWMANDVVPIGSSFALSTNVLHYDALKLAARMAGERHDPRATQYAAQADALKTAINTRFWRADRGLYMSYVLADGTPVDSYDLLGLALAIDSGVAPVERARLALANYPVWPAGSPVIWPERRDQPIYHNRAIWPFVSMYALRAARRLDDPAHIAFEIESLMRGAALAGSNMENYELATQAVHVDDGKLSGPVVNSPRQLWSVAGYLGMVGEGVFGVRADGTVEPKLPVALVPMLFGTADTIALALPMLKVTLHRPATLDGNLLVADRVTRHGHVVDVTLKAISVPVIPLRTHAPLYAPVAPPAPTLSRDGADWLVQADTHGTLYANGKALGAIDGTRHVTAGNALQCFHVTTRGDGGLESLPGAPRCVGPVAVVSGAWPRAWTAPASGTYQLTLDYANALGPINTGITAAVKRLAITCAGSATQTVPVVMPHSLSRQLSTPATFRANAGAHCTFALEDGFNMSYLAHNAHYTGGTGGASGALNTAAIDTLRIVPLPAETP